MSITFQILKLWKNTTCNQYPKSQKKKKEEEKDLQLEILREKSWKFKIALKSKTQVVYKLGRLLKRTKGFKLE